MLLTRIIERLRGFKTESSKSPTLVPFARKRGNEPTEFPLEAVKGKSYLGDDHGHTFRGTVAYAVDRDGHIQVINTEGKVAFCVTAGFGSWHLKGDDLKVYINYCGDWTIFDVRSSL